MQVSDISGTANLENIYKGVQNMPVTQSEKGQRFVDLHAAQQTFIIANPWDVPSAKIMQGLGFLALATTSSGFAYTLGKHDGEPTLEEKLEHCRLIAAATDVPVSADFEDGYAADPAQVAANVTQLIETGVAGCSIEDYDRDNKVLFELSHAVDRISAVVEVVSKLDFPFTLTARAEHLLRSGPDLDIAISRLQAYEAAGADVLFAPGINNLEDLSRLTGEVSKPVNALGVLIPGASVEDIQGAGAKRISIGGALAFASAKPIIEMGETMLNEGTFDWVSQMASPARVAKLMA